MGEKLENDSIPFQKPISEEQITPAFSDAPDLAPISEGSIPEAKIVSANRLEVKESEMDILEAELKALELIEKEAKLEEKEAKTELDPNKVEKSASNKTKNILNKIEIKKHNRTRVDHKKEKDFVLIPNEPDPISVPEIEAPETYPEIESKEKELFKEPEIVEPIQKTESLINTSVNTDADLNFPFLNKEKEKELTEKRKRHQDVLKKFLKQGASSKTKVKKKRKNRKKIIFLSAIFSVLTLVVGFVAYVNIFETNTPKVVQREESKTEFNYQKPEYVPPGYEVTFLTKGSKDGIVYFYEFGSDKKRTLTISVQKTTISENDLFR